MNFCKIELANSAKASQDLESFAKELKSSLNLTASLEDIVSSLNDLIAETKDQGSIISSSDFQDFFKIKDKINNVLYVEARRKLLTRLTDTIFGDNPALTNVQLDAKLKFLQSRTKKRLGNSATKLHYMYTFQKESVITSANIDQLVDYLIAYHLPLVVQSIGNGLIRENKGKFEFDVKAQVRTDWNTDSFEEHPAELNNAVRMMLDVTPMLDYEGNPVKDYHLTNNSFFFAVASLFERLEKEFNHNLHEDLRSDFDLIEITRNPVKLIEFLSTWDEKDDSLESNILRSFIFKWIRTKDGELTPFAKNCLKSTDSFCYNPLNLLITSAIKYSTNTFLDRTYSKKNAEYKEGIAVLNSARSLWSEAGARISNNIDKEILSELPENYEEITREQIVKVLKKLFPYHTISIPNDSDLFAQWKNNFKLFYDYKNSRTKLFSDFIKQHSENSTDSIAERYYWIIRHTLNTNPYLIKGTQKNNMDKQVPVYGLRTVATSIPQQIAILKSEIFKKNKRLAKHGVLEYHISNFEHSSLFTGKIALPKTVYNSSFLYEGSKPFTKEYRDLTAKEMAHLAIYYDYLNGGGKIRIQPITVSDKPRVPMFEWNLDEILKTKSLLEMQDEIESFYKQTILNTLHEYNEVLELGIESISESVNQLSWETIISFANTVNDQLRKRQITRQELWEAAERFNQENETNVTFADRLDFKQVKSENGEKIIQLSDAIEFYSTGMSKPDFWKNRFLDFLTSLKPICPDISVNEQPLIEHITNLIDEIESGNTSYLDDKLFEYFVVHNFLAENVLINTVGLPLTHKGKGGSYEAYDSAANLTMVKRMVALTATMHSCTKGLLSGMCDEIKTQTIHLGEKEMYTYSGNTPSGAGSINNLDISDGIIYGIRATNNLMLASIGDVRPKGNMLKILHSELDPYKGQGRLIKCAEAIIDNAMIRNFGLNESDAEKVGAFSPKNFMKLALQSAKLADRSFDSEENILIDYAGNTVVLNVYKKINDEVYKLDTIELNPDTNTLVLAFENTTTGETILENCALDLYSLWEAFGGAFSCDREGNYNEGSQDAITILMNSIGDTNADTDPENVMSQDDVDQYLKKQAVFFIHTTSAQKSLQAPSSTLQEALNGKGFTVKMGIDRLGIQLNADHTAEDSHIREISQLMSNLAEGGYVSEKADKVYSRIQNLIQTSLAEIGIDELKFSKLPEEIQQDIRTKLNKKFGQIFKRIMSSPDADVMGLTNALAVELQKYNLFIPVSDRQHLAKYHTTVGSYFNKFIARAWTGRADVLMPGYNMLMVYEDVDGTVYLPGDNHVEIDDNGEILNQTNIRNYLNELMFVDEEGLIINTEFAYRYRTTKHAIQPDQIYYMVNEDGSYALYKTDTYDKMMNLAKMMENNENLILIKAYNLPRNLNAKSVGVVVNGEYHDIYFFKTHREIMRCGKLISQISELKLNKPEDKNKFIAILSENSDLFGEDNIKKIKTTTDAINKLTELKQQYSDTFQTILGEISSGNFGSCEKELNLPFIDGEYTFEVSIKHDERITSNNYSHVWGHAAHSEIAQLKNKYFEKRLNTLLSGSSEWSAIFKESFNVLSLYSLSSKMSFCTWDINSLKEGYVEHSVILDEDGYRLNPAGKRMYKWPQGARLFSKGGYEIILVKDPSQISTLTDSSYYIGYRANNKIKGLDLEYFGTNSKDTEFYKEFISGHAIKQYNSWLKTNHGAEARIPSQSLSFAMHLKTVGYCPWDTNISICSNAHVFTQGSDFDIDKIYVMMYSIDNTGIIKQSEEYTFHVSTETVINLSDEDVVINNMFANLIEAGLNRPSAKTLAQGDETITQLYDQIVKYLLGVDKLSGSNITINENYIIEYIQRTRDLSFEDLATIHTLTGLIVEKLNDKSESIFDLKADKYGGLQNGTLDQMIDIFDDLKILMPSTSPTTMFPINDVVERRNLEAAKRNHLNPTSLWYVNQTAMVGKDGVGITASAQKAMLALTQYNSMRKNEDISHVTMLKLPRKWRKYTHNGVVVNTEFFVNFVFPGQKINKETLQGIYKWVSDSKDLECTTNPENPKNGEIIESMIIKGAQFGKEGKRIYIGQPIDTVLATTINSAFISSATDNAKEMKLDLIGGHPLLLPAFMYGLTLGMPVDLLVSIFTDKDVQEWVLDARGNVFQGVESPVHISERLSNFKLRTNITIDDFVDELGNDITNSIKDSGLTIKQLSSYSKESISKKAGISVESAHKVKEIISEESKSVDLKKKVLKTLLKGGEALTALSRILSINQGLKVNLGEVQQWFLNIEKNIRSLVPAYIDNYVDGYARFNAYEFFGDLKYASKEELRQYAKRREDPEIAFNVIDVLATVSHYYAMCQIPLVLKSVMENQSSDIRLLHTIMAEDHRENGFVDKKNISKYIQSINHIKIFEFLRRLDWKYKTDKAYTAFKEIKSNPEGEYELSTSEARGIYTLKSFIEDKIINVMKQEYSEDDNITNAFLANIQKVTKPVAILGGEPMKALGISFNMTHPQNYDLATLVKLGFYEIQDKVIEGHKFGEWMFVYDLLVNHHDVANNSFTNIFDQMIDLNDPENIITQYYNLVIEHDSTLNRISGKETNSLIPTRIDPDEMPEGIGSFRYGSSHIYPLRIDAETRTKGTSYLDITKLQEYKKLGKLLILNC